MKKIWRFFGVIAFGIIFLCGCGDGQVDGLSGVQPVEVEGIHIESNGQGGNEESGERIKLTLGTLGTGRILQRAVESFQ